MHALGRKTCNNSEVTKRTNWISPRKIGCSMTRAAQNTHPVPSSSLVPPSMRGPTILTCTNSLIVISLSISHSNQKQKSKAAVKTWKGFAYKNAVLQWGLGSVSDKLYNWEMAMKRVASSAINAFASSGYLRSSSRFSRHYVSCLWSSNFIPFVRFHFWLSLKFINQFHHLQAQITNFSPFFLNDDGYQIFIWIRWFICNDKWDLWLSVDWSINLEKKLKKN